MLLELFRSLSSSWSGFGIFNYLTLRALLGARDRLRLRSLDDPGT